MVHKFLIGRLRFGPIEADSMAEAAKVEPDIEVISMDQTERVMQAIVCKGLDDLDPFSPQFEWSGDQGEVLVDPIILQEGFDLELDYEKSAWFTINGDPILYHGQAWQIAQNAIVHIKRALELLGNDDVESAQGTLQNFINLNALRR